VPADPDCQKKEEGLKESYLTKEKRFLLSNRKTGKIFNLRRMERGPKNKK
jgi:hypothetical protein